MLDAFKSFPGSKNRQLQVQKQTTELEQLIASAREERSAIGVMLASLATGGAKLAPLTKSLDQANDTAAGLTKRLDEMAIRLTALDTRTKEVEELDRRIQGLKDAADQAAKTAERTMGPDGELQKH